MFLPALRLSQPGNVGQFVEYTSPHQQQETSDVASCCASGRGDCQRSVALSMKTVCDWSTFWTASHTHSTYEQPVGITIAPFYT